MAECIEQAALKKWLTSIPLTDLYDGRKLYRVVMEDDFRRAIKALPALMTTDVAPVVHSCWEEYTCSQYMGKDEYGEPKLRDGRFYVCHNRNCRRKTAVKSSYCPNCGARMDGDEE